MNLHRSASLSRVAAAAIACVVVAGCASKGPTPSDAASAPAPAAPSAPPAPPVAAAPAAPPPAPVRKGLSYGDVQRTAGSGDAKAVRSQLVGKTVTLDLSRPKGQQVPAGSFVVGDAGPDSVLFRCKASVRGFAGGEVIAQVASYQYVPHGKRHVVELDRCDLASVPASVPPPQVAAAPVPAAKPAPTPATPAAPAPAPAEASSEPPVGAGKPGMDAQGRVVDSKKVEAGSGRTVKGLNDYEGEITGIAAPNSKFTQLQIGMPVRQVTDIAGSPTDQGAYITGKAWIPFYFGGDRYRFEMTYKGQGRLIFAGGGMGDFSNGHLIWIVHNSNEPGYR